MTVEQLTTCRFCPVSCGMVVELDGDRVAGVRGDDAHPLSRGYLCPKGRALPAFHHHADRLDRPSVDGTPTDWDTTLDDLGRRLRAVVDRHGTEAVGLYTATGGASDTAGRAAVGSFFRKLGPHQRYTAATVDVAPALRAAQLVTGFHWEIRPEWFPDEDAPRLAVVLGSNPVVSHGYVGLMLPDPVRRLREYRAGGGELWVLDPRRTETAALADHHLAVRPGSDAVILAFLARELLDDGADADELRRYTRPDDLARLRGALAPFTVGHAAERSGIAAATLHSLLDSIRRVGRIAISSGTGMTFAPEAMLTEWLRWVVLVLTGSIDNPGGMWVDTGWLTPMEQRTEWTPRPEADVRPAPRSRTDLPMWFDEVPCIAMVDEIEAGNLRALVVNGGSPLTALPDPDRTAAALHALDVLVVVDVLATELTTMATHVLPAAGVLERSDLSSWLHHIAYAPQLVPVGADRRQTWWMFAQLARRLGFDLLGGRDPDTNTNDAQLAHLAASGRGPTDELFAAGPRGVFTPRVFGWVHERVLPDGHWRIAPPEMVDRLPELLRPVEPAALVLVSGRTVHHVNRVGYGPLGRSGGAATLRLHPEDARTRGVADGDMVEVRSAGGTTSAAVNLDERLRPGVAHLAHGSIHANVARLVRRHADPAHGQPVMSAIAIEVVPVPVPPRPAGTARQPDSGRRATSR